MGRYMFLSEYTNLRNFIQFLINSSELDDDDKDVFIEELFDTDNQHLQELLIAVGMAVGGDHSRQVVEHWKKIGNTLPSGIIADE